MTNDNRNLLQVLEALVKVVGQALCCLAHSVDVHAVAAGTHDATQATSTELEFAVERVNERSLVLVIEHCLNLFSCLFVIGRRKPLCSLFRYHFNKFLIHSLYFIVYYFHILRREIPADRKYTKFLESTRDFTLFCIGNEITVASLLNNLSPIVGRIARTCHLAGQTAL